MRVLEFFVPSPRVTSAGKRQGWWGWNDVIDAGSNSRYGRQSQKDGAERHVARFAREAMEACGWRRPEGRSLVELTFVEPDRIRDPDNVMCAKYVMDALSTPKVGRRVTRNKYGVSAIVDDSQRYVELRMAIAEETDRERPGVLVRIACEEDQ